MQASTCTRQVQVGSHSVCEQIPQYSQVCHKEPDHEECYYTDSRQDCRPGPDRQECYYEQSRQDCRPGPMQEQCHQGPSEQQCRPGPTREECRDLPSRQQCHQEGGGIVCTVENGRRICRNEPGRQVCENIPGGRVCQTVSGQQICNTVPGRRICEMVQGRDICTTIPGRQVCNTVPGNPICTTIPGERICQNIPGENFCNSVLSGYKTVCHDEADYKTETYACQKPVKVPYVVTFSTKAQIDLNFVNDSGLSHFDLIFSLDRSGKMTIKTKEKGLIIFSKEISTSNEVEGETTLVRKQLTLTFKNIQGIVTPMNSSLRNAKINGGELSFVMGKVTDATLLQFDISLFGKSIFPIYKLVDLKKSVLGTEVEMSVVEGGTLVKINLSSDHLAKRKYDLKIVAKINLDDLGTALNLPGTATLTQELNAKVKNN